MKITLRSWPMIWLQYLCLLRAVSFVIFKWYLQEQLALTVKLQKTLKGELSTESAQFIFWSWILATLNSPSILFWLLKTCVDIKSLLTTSNRLLFLNTESLHINLTLINESPSTLLKISGDKHKGIFASRTVSVSIIEHKWYRLFSILTSTDNCRTVGPPHIPLTTLTFDIELLYSS